jgi:Tfp pilus assembly pilus retraction ATPase PilT
LRSAKTDPDVILIGEMRDLETSRSPDAAETGHLVFSTLHTVGAAKTIDRIIDVFRPVSSSKSVSSYRPFSRRWFPTAGSGEAAVRSPPLRSC